MTAEQTPQQFALAVINDAKNNLNKLGSVRGEANLIATAAAQAQIAIAAAPSPRAAFTMRQAGRGGSGSSSRASPRWRSPGSSGAHGGTTRSGTGRREMTPEQAARMWADSIREVIQGAEEAGFTVDIIASCPGRTRLVIAPPGRELTDAVSIWPTRKESDEGT